MRVVSHPEADAEIGSRCVMVRRTTAGACEDFLDEFERPLRHIVAEPERWRKIRGENRKLNFGRFPYAIVFSVQSDTIYIKAVMHLHRRPFYWQGRE